MCLKYSKLHIFGENIKPSPKEHFLKLFLAILQYPSPLPEQKALPLPGRNILFPPPLPAHFLPHSCRSRPCPSIGIENRSLDHCHLPLGSVQKCAQGQLLFKELHNLLFLFLAIATMCLHLNCVVSGRIAIHFPKSFPFSCISNID